LVDLLPGLLFNHAILKVTSKENKDRIYWIDATNFASMAQGIFPDIAGKMSLVIDKEGSTYEKIPEVKDDKIIYTTELEIGGDNLLTFTGNIDLKGEAALQLTGAGLNMSAKQLNDSAFYVLSGTNLPEKDKKELIRPDLTSRIVKDINIKYKYDQYNQLVKTNLGQGLSLSSQMPANIIDNTDEYVNDLYIGYPSTRIYRTTIKNAKIKQISKLNYEVDTPWLYIKRACRDKDNKSEIEDTIITKTSYILNEDLKSQIYRDLSNGLKKDCLGVMAILEKND
jgi:hypothetical protein